MEASTPLQTPIDLALSEPALDPEALAASVGAWLAAEARFLDGNDAVLAAFAERVVTRGIPLARVSLHLRALHPQYGGVTRAWYRDGPMQQEFFDHGVERSPRYLASPIRAVVESAARLEWRLDGSSPPLFPIFDELKRAGLTHYVAAPLLYAEGAINAITFATDRPGGFTPADLRFFDAVLPHLGAAVEVRALRRFLNSLLTTYVGREPGRLILDGQIQRGDVRTITAALMLVDLRDFTLLSDRLGPRAVIDMLNQYFDCVMPPIRRHGGEVMEIMGDGVLAIFNHADARGATDACANALAAAKEGSAALAAANRERGEYDPELRAGCALHYGTVSYGNIGSEDRLDFTVIGPDVNLTSRIERLCRELDHNLLMSDDFVTTLDRPMFALGHFQLRGFARMQRLFALPPEEERNGIEGEAANGAS